MKIHLNEVFNTYEVTECDRKFGNEITLDGKVLIPLDDVEQAIEKIIELDGEYLTLYDGVNKLGNGLYVEIDEVLEILNGLILAR